MMTEQDNEQESTPPISEFDLSALAMAHNEPAFKQLVRDMRRAQCQYFASRKGLDLEAAKRIERRVDAVLCWRDG